MKILAYYLPQYHEIPENNAWWGKGFTEWSNVKKAQKLFEGHYQPRIPLNNNYYDLTDIETIKWQVELAKKYGVYGFCFYHYWFNGKLLLEKPMELLLENKQIDIPFCVCWANENWTNGWATDKNEILISHNSEDRDDWKKHFYYLLPFLKDSRYIKEDGKPLLVIYYPNIIISLNEMLEYWDGLAKEEGFQGIKFIYQHHLFHFKTSADKSHFDYGIEFQPQYAQVAMEPKRNLLRTQIIIKISSLLQKHLGLYISKKSKAVKQYNYDDVWKKILEMDPDNDKMLPGAFVDWDNTPRKKKRGSVFIGGSPEKFGFYLKQLIVRARDVYKKNIIFMFAWNEWGEGGYLEPDEKYGYAYLEEIKSALDELDEFPIK